MRSRRMLNKRKRHSRVLRVVDGFKFRFLNTLANGNLRWVCCKKTCGASIKYDVDGTVCGQNTNHNHKPDDPHSISQQKYWKQIIYQTIKANPKKKTASKNLNTELLPELNGCEQMEKSITGRGTSDGIHGTSESRFEDGQPSGCDTDSEENTLKKKLNKTNLVRNDDELSIISSGCNEVNFQVVNVNNETQESKINITKKNDLEELMSNNNTFMTDISKNLQGINAQMVAKNDGIEKIAVAMNRMADAFERLADAISVNSYSCL